MRRTVAVVVAVALGVTACSGGSDSSIATPSDDSAAEASDTDGDGAPTDTLEDAAADDPEFEDVGPPPTDPEKPSVSLPEVIPEDLVRTVLIEGSGEPAENGDTVIVDYIGVRSVDGVEFDNSYDRFQPFPVQLGSGGVIQGWDLGLLEARTGDRLQLDIPSALAYGPQERGDVIRADEPLTFVIDVRAVIKAADPADQPTSAGVDASEGATELSFVDLIEGDGATAETGQTAIIHVVLFRGDSLRALDSTWESEAIQVPLVDGSFPALVEGIVGMKVGGRRTIIAPPELGFGPDGNPQLGLPAATDLLLTVDLLGLY